MNDTELDRLMKAGLEARTATLPSNFTHRVMQSVVLARLQQARRRAVWESTMVSLATALAGIGILLATGAFIGVNLDVSLTGGGVVPALVILAGFFLIDTRLSLTGNDANSA